MVDPLVRVMMLLETLRVELVEQHLAERLTHQEVMVILVIYREVFSVVVEVLTRGLMEAGQRQEELPD